VGNDGGIWSTVDGGTTWMNHNDGLVITQFYAGSVHPHGADLALGGSQDNGTEVWTGSSRWQWVLDGDGGPSALSMTNPDTHWAASFEGLKVFRTVDAQQFCSADAGIDKEGVGFIAPLVKCPANRSEEHTSELQSLAY